MDIQRVLALTVTRATEVACDEIEKLRLHPRASTLAKKRAWTIRSMEHVTDRWKKDQLILLIESCALQAKETRHFKSSLERAEDSGNRERIELAWQRWNAYEANRPRSILDLPQS
jgi:hypothetical protein